MKISSLMRDAILLALALVSFQTVQGILLKDALEKQERAAAHRLCAGIADILNKAHRAKDDLLTWQVVSALQKAPGVTEAHLDDRGDPAHARPNSYAYSLREGGHPWGRLVLSLSDRPLRRLVKRSYGGGLGAACCLWMGVVAYRHHLEKRFFQLHVQVEEFRGMLEAETVKRKEAERREQVCARQRSAWLEAALGQISSPLVLLDGRQRLAAANPPAAALLGAQEPRDLSGKSWQDVSILSDCGLALAQSLEAPECRVRKKDNASGRTTEFFTMSPKEGVQDGTWVRFLEEA